MQAFYLLNAEGILGEREFEVYEYLLAHPNSTDLEITRGLDKEDPNYVRPRRRSLVQYGLIEEAGKRPCMYSPFRVSLTWSLVEKPDFSKVAEIKSNLSKRHKCPYCEGKGYLLAGQVKLNGFDGISI